MSNGPSTIEQLAGELAQLFDPLARRLENDTVDSLLPWLGLRVPDTAANATDLANALDTCATAAASLAPLIEDLAAAVRDEDDAALISAGTALLQHLATLIQAARDVAAGLEALSAGLTPAQQAELSAFAGVFMERLLNRLVVEFLETAYPQFTLALLLTGAVEIEEVEGGPADSLNGAYTRKTLHVDRAAKIFTDPKGLLREVYGWGEPGFDGLALFKQLQMVLDRKFEIPAELLQPPGEPALLEAFGFNLEVNDTVSPPGLDVSLRAPSELDDSDTIDAGDWKATFDGHTSYSADLTATVRPFFDVELHMGAGTVDARLGATFERSRTADPFLILGEAGKSRLEIRSPSAERGDRPALRPRHRPDHVRPRAQGRAARREAGHRRPGRRLVHQHPSLQLEPRVRLRRRSELDPEPGCPVYRQCGARDRHPGARVAGPARDHHGVSPGPAGRRWSDSG